MRNIISKTKPYLGFEEFKTSLSFEKDVVEKFEKEFSRKIGMKYGVSFAYGRSALYTFLKSENISKKKVLMPAYTCIVVPNAVNNSGNVSSFTDISKNNFCPDFSNTNITEKTACVIPTHMYGYYNEFRNIKDNIADKKLSTKIIEDACLAIGTKNVGKYSDGAFYSFNIAKQICTFDGGMFTTNNEEIYEKIKNFRDINFKKQNFSSVAKKMMLFKMSYIFFNNKLYSLTYKTYYSSMNKLLSSHMKNWSISDTNLPSDYNSFLSGFQAKIGLAQLKRIDEMTQKRRKIAAKYDKELKGINWLKLPPLEKMASYSHYPLIVDDKKKVLLALKDAGLNLGQNFDFDYSIPSTKPYMAKNQELYKNSKYISKHIITIPIRPNLSEKDIDFIIRKIHEVK